MSSANEKGPATVAASPFEEMGIARETQTSIPNVKAPASSAFNSHIRCAKALVDEWTTWATWHSLMPSRGQRPRIVSGQCKKGLACGGEALQIDSPH